jgi:hypothetical protein
VRLHTVDEHSAKALNLPTSLVETRKQRALAYCTHEYFDFICLVESIHLANLTLKMMLAYNNGNIVNVIKMSILSHIKQQWIVFHVCPVAKMVTTMNFS